MPNDGHIKKDVNGMPLEVWNAMTVEEKVEFQKLVYREKTRRQSNDYNRRMREKKDENPTV